MQLVAGSSVVEDFLADWAASRAEPDFRLPVSGLGDREVAAELGRIQRNRAREAAREAELILRLAQLRPDADDPPPGTPGAGNRTWRRTDPEFPGVSEFFSDEVAHAINLGRGTAAFRARRAWTWRENLPATFAALRRGEIDERRAGVLAEALQHAAPELARAVEATVLPGAGELSLAGLRRAALERLAELDSTAIDQRHEQAQRAADVRAYATADGMATLAGDLTVEEAAACFDVIDQLAAMARADGDPRPIGQIRAAMHAMLLLRPADSGLPAVTVNLTVAATLTGLEGTSTRGGEVNGFPLTAAQVRDLLRRVGALGLVTPEGGSLTYALSDERGRLLATVTAADLARLAAAGCPRHPDGGAGTDCACPVIGPPSATEGYRPSAALRRFVTTRDRRCRTPNCGQRAGWADHDHVVPHAHGGPTTCTNLCCLCRSHHRLKTFARGWTFRMEPDGTLHVTSPSAITRTT
ncbi:MAG: hypothetical protein AVDCRST_MAG52-3558, partial [uncultured Blastococcus sp.]